MCDDQVAVVLAAGRGTRMGGPKALMTVGGRPWWVWQSERLARERIPSLWVVSPEVRAGIERVGPAPFPMVEGDSESPQFESFMAAVRVLSERPPEGVYVLPVDCPAPPRGVWQALCEAGDVAVPTFMDGKGHPVYLPWEWVAEALRAMPDHDRASQLRLDALIAPVAKLVNVHDPSVAVDLDTPEDVARWLALHGPAAT